MDCQDLGLVTLQSIPGEYKYSTVLTKILADFLSINGDIYVFPKVKTED